MEKNNNDIRIVNLSVEDLTPQNIGSYMGNNNKWVDYGINNDYPVYLRKLYLSSPTHQAICDSTINLATGEGVTIKDKVNNSLLTLSSSVQFDLNIPYPSLGCSILIIWIMVLEF